MSMIRWIRTSRLLIKNSLSLVQVCEQLGRQDGPFAKMGHSMIQCKQVSPRHRTFQFLSIIPFSGTLGCRGVEISSILKQP